MNEALVENSEHEIDHEHGHEEQQTEALERRLERLRGSLKRRADGGRNDRCSSGLDLRNRITEGHAGREIERQRDRGKLALMLHGERPGVLLHLRYGAEWDKLAAIRT